MDHVHHKITFPGPAGSLSGNLQLPGGTPRGGVLLAHCFTCSKSLKITRQLATGIEAGGFAVLRFDFTGLGESEGEFAETSVSTNVADLEAAAAHLETLGLGPCVMVGHSLGGAATLLAAGNLPEVRAVVAVAAPSGPEHVQHLFAGRDIDKVFDHGRATVSIAGRDFQISRTFFDDLQTHCSPERIAALNRPLLVVHGTADRIVAIEEGERIFAAAGHPKWFAAVPGADHLFTIPRTADLASRAILAFLDAAL